MHQNSQHVDNNGDNQRVNNGSIHRGGVVVGGRGDWEDMLLGNRICNIIESLPRSTHWLPLNLKFVDSPNIMRQGSLWQTNSSSVHACYRERALVLRCGQVFRTVLPVNWLWSRNSLSFINPGSSLLCTQKPNHRQSS